MVEASPTTVDRLLQRRSLNGQEVTMKYSCLSYIAETKRKDAPTRDYLAKNVRSGTASITDGPFAETKEIVAASMRTPSRVPTASSDGVESAVARSTTKRAAWQRWHVAPPRRTDASPRNPSRRSIMNYVDGFVAAVPTANRDAYRKHAEAAAVVFKEHGALAIVECWGDDVPEGKLTSFPQAVKRQPDETVVFSWVTWPSRRARDAGMKKVMADSRLQPDANPMPFDGKRLIYGGFEMIVNR
jgi:uncharacterized protein YbaA (DUF1428 family)